MTRGKDAVSVALIKKHPFGQADRPLCSMLNHGAAYHRHLDPPGV
ncbi:hypothetical protein [Nitrosomonas sp. Is37]|nr:hypothetical protein [Nitrosomonas sp. Is37]MDV6345006.1 hypothetical protein [Nitrosomonas sp. Is37]